MLVVKPHSVVGLITNSSTVIYTYTTETSLAILKDIVNHILEKAGIDKKAEDLFEFKLGPSEAEIEIVADKHWSGILEGMAYEDSLDYTRRMVESGEWEVPKPDWDDIHDSGQLIITAKDGDENTEPIFNKLYSLFDQEAAYNG